MMSRKGLMPEADFFCPIPHEPLTIFTEEAVQGLIEAGETGLLDRTYGLFEEQLRLVDPDYADKIGRIPPSRRSASAISPSVSPPIPSRGRRPISTRRERISKPGLPFRGAMRS
jgi:hypothetical protein